VHFSNISASIRCGRPTDKLSHYSFAKNSLIILLNVCAYSPSLVLCLGEEVFCVQQRKVVSVIQASQLMLYREIIAVFSQIHTKHINTLCAQNVELLNVKLVVHTVTTVRYI